MIQDIVDGCMAMMATLTFLTAQAMSGKVVHISHNVGKYGDGIELNPTVGPQPLERCCLLLLLLFFN